MVLFVAIPSVVSAATYCDGNPEGNCYVDGSVASSGDGKTPSTAFKTIQEAADVVGPGDTVNVKGGITYAESVTPANSGSAGNYITYQAWEGTGVPTINAEGVSSGYLLSGISYNIISGFFITDGTSSGLMISNGGNIIIKNNSINDSNMGIYLDIDFDDNFSVYNNITYNNSFAGIILEANDSTGVELKNNIVFGSNYGLYFDRGGDAAAIDYNLLWDNQENYLDCTPGAHDISADPLFVDPDSNDFRLQAGSPAIDAGATLSEVTDDIIGIPRPQGSAYDIGAYEYYDIPVTLDSETESSFDSPTPTFTGTVSTVSTGTIVIIEYSLDGGSWTALGVSATDRAFDESEEEFSITLPYALDEGEHTIQIRATDSYGNTTYSTMYASLEFEILEDLPETGSDLLFQIVIILTAFLYHTFSKRENIKYY
ncbi:MAG: choice-of-anchor Q domain-containing protein [Candidatus Dojkabacteria bacterium]|nr:choice-of-anchor Q domain-containing protein [Candidatus Dojkabacteria bacterium]